MPKHEHGDRMISEGQTISAQMETSHQHTSSECGDCESEVCHNSHCVYIFVKNVSITQLEVPDLYVSSEVDQYYFSFKSFLLRPPIA